MLEILLKPCECGNKPKVVKGEYTALKISRYKVKCCKETKAISSATAAIIDWNKGKYND